VAEKLFEVRVGLTAVLTGQSTDLLCVRSIDGGDFNAHERTRGARMRLRNVSAADESDIRGHLTFENSQRIRGSAIISEGFPCFNQPPESPSRAQRAPNRKRARKLDRFGIDALWCRA
jgi:hypothetical protein